ncbi:SH3 domain-containing protein [Streptomyces bobili]|uniref:SH3 domain-containing protein n=1 Tax=Streptomyces bobili TaxID=67280 RepID=UPI0036E998BD
MASSTVSRKVRRTLGVTLAALGLAAGANLAAATPGSAAAAISCSGWGHSNKDAGAGISLGTHALKVGPYTTCGNVSGGQTYYGTYLYYHCHVRTESGSTWTYARIANTQTAGWFSDANLELNPDGQTRGAIALC